MTIEMLLQLIVLATVACFPIVGAIQIIFGDNHFGIVNRIFEIYLIFGGVVFLLMTIFAIGTIV